MTAQTATAVRPLEIDRSHSDVAFQVRHLLSKVRGRFNEFAGTIEFDESNPDNSRVDVTIQAGSIDTAEPDRDKHLRSADFFDVENYPTLRFVSTSVTPRGGNELRRERRPDDPRRDAASRAACDLCWRGDRPVGEPEVGFRGRTAPEPQGFRPYVERGARNGWVSRRG